MLTAVSYARPAFVPARLALRGYRRKLVVMLRELCRKKEEEVNEASKTLIKAVEYLAEQEDRETDEVMQDLMNNPATVFPALFSAENMQQFMPDSVQQVRLCAHSLAPDTASRVLRARGLCSTSAPAQYCAACAA